MKMAFSINQPISRPTIIKKPVQQPLPTSPISYDFFNRKPMFQGIVAGSNCTSCGK
jgi:hypothetical protein